MLTVEDVPVTAPCGASWSEMDGSRQRRRCGDCQRSVHDLSMMRLPEVAALLLQPTPPCVRYRYSEETGRIDMPIAAAESAAQAMAAGLPAAMAARGGQRALALAGLAAAVRRAFGGA